MAETPFAPETGSESGGAVPEGDSQAVADLAAAGAEPVSQAEASLAGLPDAASQPGTADEWVDSPAVPEPGAVAAEPAGTVAVEPSIEPWATSPAAVASPAAGGESGAFESPIPPAAAEPVAAPAGVVATVVIPPLEEGGEGGEWQLLVGRINAWLASGELSRQWQRFRGPLKGLAIVVLLVLLLRVYATAVATIDAIPLVSGLLELTGLIAVLRFSATQLVRSGDRRALAERLQRRWRAFSGRG
jgi:CAAD domains of cyanobacterial aminoacyl-tRNA synthetase